MNLLFKLTIFGPPNEEISQMKQYLSHLAKATCDRRRPPVIKVFVRTQTQGAWVGYAPETKMDGSREKTWRLFAHTSDWA